MNIHARLNRIKFQLKNGSYPNKEIQGDYNKLGETAFSFEILDYLDPREDLHHDYSEELKILEDMWLEKLQPYGDKGYNKK